jgi:drug/metabolite transporter (DMT)-like permease
VRYAYIAFILFCMLSAARDGLSELLFKDSRFAAHPIFVLFVFSVTTQVIAALVAVMLHRPHWPVGSASYAGVAKDLLNLNVFTLIAYVAYFYAISTPLGAGLNSFIDYGSGPLLTALVAKLLLGERLDKAFAVAAVVSSLGLLLFGVTRVELGATSLPWLVGVALALLSSLSSALYRVFFKRLLNKGMAREWTIFYRLMGLSVGLGVMLLLYSDYVQLRILAPLIVLAIVGFAVPLLLVVFVIQQFALRSFAMMLFLLPVMTYGLSAALGYSQPRLLDIPAASLVLAGVIFHELPRVRTPPVCDR